MKVYINGEIIDEKEAKISVFDRGYLYGDAVFETMRSYGGAIFRLVDHIERLCSSLKSLKIRQRLSNREMEKAVYEALGANSLDDATIRITVSRGISKERSFNISMNETANVVITAAAYTPRPSKFYEQGIKIDISRYKKNSYSLLPRFKVPNYLESIMARNEAMPRGSFETIFLNESGFVCEGTVSNIFMVKGKRLMTPSINCGVLPGITRKIVLELSSYAGLGKEEGRFGKEELNESDEVFITNSVIEIIPVVAIDSSRIGNGKIGPSTRNLHRLYKDLVDKETKDVSRR